MTAPDLRTTVAGVGFANPVFTAAGCAGTGRELAPYLDLSGLGALVTRSVTLDGRAGAPLPRLAETVGGTVYAGGLPGTGIDGFLATELPWLLQQDARVVVSMAATTLAEFAELTLRVGNSPGVAAVEVNLGWPPGGQGGEPYHASKIVSVVRRDLPGGIPVLAKVPADVRRAVDVTRSVTTAGADGVVLGGGLPALALDPGTLRPALGSVTGELGGPAIHAHTLRTVWEVHAAMPDTPIVAVGGVRTGFDALSLIAAGASAVQVGSAVLHDPAAPARVLDELEHELARRGFTTLADLIGRAHHHEGVHR